MLPNGIKKELQPDQNMMAPQMRNSYEFRLVQVPSYFGCNISILKKILNLESLEILKMTSLEH